ncbi:MAG: flippase-like domain-containing protein [Syntrophobacteraceae bacterium]|nr:flippase-like domain-containing protein [Syntrophobacteraceae bacterium]
MSTSPINSRIKGAASFLLGAGLLAWLVVSIGADSILADLSRVGAGLLVILALEFVVDALNTLGWWYTLPVAERKGVWRRLFWVRSAGNALNESTPAASLGGEPAKVVLLRGWISTPAAAASLLSTKVSYGLGAAIFIAAGAAAVRSRLSLPKDMVWALFFAFAMMIFGIAMFAILQIRGIGAGALRGLQWLRIPKRWLTPVESLSNEIDAQLSDFYRARRGDLFRAVGAHLCGFGCSALQALLILEWLHLGLDPQAALGIAAFTALVAIASFAVPASLGVQEGGSVLIFWAMGLPSAAAMAAGIAFRLVWLIKTALGVVVFILLKRRSPAPVDPTGD